MKVVLSKNAHEVEVSGSVGLRLRCWADMQMLRAVGCANLVQPQTRAEVGSAIGRARVGPAARCLAYGALMLPVEPGLASVAGDGARIITILTGLLFWSSARKMICSLICKQMSKRDDGYGSVRSRAAAAVDHCREASDRGGESGAWGQCCRGCSTT